MSLHGLVVSRTDGSNRWRLTPSGHVGKEERGRGRGEERGGGGCSVWRESRDGDGRRFSLLYPLASEAWRVKGRGGNGRRVGARRERIKVYEEKSKHERRG